MSWAKFIGGAIGAAVGGPIGAGIGVALGAGFDEHQEEQQRRGLNQVGQDAPFQATQIGNILRLMSRLSLPAAATHVLVRVGYRDRCFKALVSHFGDDDGDFALRKRVVDRGVTLEVPLLALAVERDLDRVLDVMVAVFSDSGLLGRFDFPVEVFVARDRWSTVRWLYPVVDIATHYALRSGPWTSDKVREMKKVFEQFAGDDAHEAEALRDRLKQSPRPILDECIAALNVRFDTDELADFVLPVAAAFIIEFAGPGLSVPDEIERLGRRLHLQPAIAERVIAELTADDDFYDDERDDEDARGPDNADGNREVLWAGGILEVPRGADRDTVQKAWRKKISDLHPDKYANLPEAVQTLIKEKAQEINRARDILLR